MAGHEPLTPGKVGVHVGVRLQPVRVINVPTDLQDGSTTACKCMPCDVKHCTARLVLSRS